MARPVAHPPTQPFQPFPLPHFHPAIPLLLHLLPTVQLSLQAITSIKVLDITVTDAHTRRVLMYVHGTAPAKLKLKLTVPISTYLPSSLPPLLNSAPAFSFLADEGS